MTALRRRMLKDIQIRNLAGETQESYVRHFAHFARHFGRSPAKLGVEDIRAYQVHLTKERGLAPSSIGVATAALRFLYTVTVRVTRILAKLPAESRGIGLTPHVAAEFHRVRPGRWAPLVSPAALPAARAEEHYFNLAGAGAGDVLAHTLAIDVDFFTFALPDNTPTGEIRSVRGTHFDFTVAKRIGRDIAADDPQIIQNRGYNQNFVLRRSSVPGELAEAVVLHDPASGRTLTVSTNEPGLFRYTANFIDTQCAMKGGVRYLRAGVALETDHLPDLPNQPHFPRTTLLSNQTFRSRTVFAFSSD